MKMRPYTKGMTLLPPTNLLVLLTSWGKWGKGLQTFDLEVVFSFISSETALLGQSFCGLLDSVMSCSLPNPMLLFFFGI